MAGELEHGLDGVTADVEGALDVVRELEHGGSASGRVREAIAALDAAAARLRAWQEADAVASGASLREGGPPSPAA